MANKKHKNISVWPTTHAKIKKLTRDRKLGSITNAIDVLVFEASRPQSSHKEEHIAAATSLHYTTN